MVKALVKTPLDPNYFREDDPLYPAYSKVLAAFAGATGLADKTDIQIMGHLLRLAPTQEAKNHLVRAIEDGYRAAPETGKTASIVTLGQYYRHHFLRPFRGQGKGQTPSASSHPSVMEIDERARQNAPSLLRPPSSHAEAKKWALVRDDYRCMVSRKMDSKYWDMAVSQDESYDSEPEPNDVTHTTCVHIFSKTTNAGIDGFRKREWASHTWTILSEFGFGDIMSELNGDKVNNLTNILTLNYDLHRFFDEFNLCFEHIPNAPLPNTYTVLAHRRKLPCPDVITFTTTKTFLDLPSPKYLTIHALACKVGAMSGAAGYMDDLDDAGDGGASSVPFVEALSDRLQMLSTKSISSCESVAVARALVEPSLDERARLTTSPSLPRIAPSSGSPSRTLHITLSAYREPSVDTTAVEDTSSRSSSIKHRHAISMTPEQDMPAARHVVGSMWRTRQVRSNSAYKVIRMPLWLRKAATSVGVSIGGTGDEQTRS